jgi:hypothetical protein
LGESSEGIASSEGSDGFGSCQAHDVGVSPEEDRSGTKGAVGEAENGTTEEGGIDPQTEKACCGTAAGFRV